MSTLIAFIAEMPAACSMRPSEVVMNVENAKYRPASSDLHPALCRIVDSYYEMFMRDIWQAKQADRALRTLDAEDMIILSGLLSDAVRRIAPAAALGTFADLTMTLIGAAVRHAITVPPNQARRALALFKSMLPRSLATVI